jgi:hypothetical protein
MAKPSQLAPCGLRQAILVCQPDDLSVRERRQERERASLPVFAFADQRNEEHETQGAPPSQRNPIAGHREPHEAIKFSAPRGVLHDLI